MPDRKPAEVFPTREFISDELETRGLDQADLVDTLRDFMSGGRCMTVELAKELGATFGTGPEIWMNLERAYQKAKEDRASSIELDKVVDALCNPVKLTPEE